MMVSNQHMRSLVLEMLLVMPLEVQIRSFRYLPADVNAILDLEPFKCCKSMFLPDSILSTVGAFIVLYQSRYNCFSLANSI